LILIEYFATFFGSRKRFKEALRTLALGVEHGDLLSQGIGSYNNRTILRNLTQMIIDVVVMNDKKEEGSYQFKIWGSELEVDYGVKPNMYDTRVFVNPKVIDERFDNLHVIRILDKALSIVENRKLLS